MGSPLYMSPEQIEGGELTGASDQYALGVVMYEMLVGAPPFLGDSLNAIFNKHLTQEPPSLEEHCHFERVAEVGKVLQKALSKKPSERYPSVSEFLDAIRQASGIQNVGEGASTTCDVCSHRVNQGQDFCGACGSAVPMKVCGVCGTERPGSGTLHSMFLPCSQLAQRSSLMNISNPHGNGVLTTSQASELSSHWKSRPTWN